MEIGQLIEDNPRSFFPKKSCTKCGGENSDRTFSKKS